MRLVNYDWNGEVRPGVLEDGLVFEVPSYPSVQQVIERGDLRGAVSARSADGTELDRARLRAPITSPDKILLAAVNYRAHGSEQNTPLPSEPYFFTKFPSCIVGNGQPILVPRRSTRADWEVELAVVIGKKCKYVGKSHALEYVAGYTVANDVSYRDLQIPEGWPNKPNALGQNWVMGKALDSALPLGPWLVTPEEVGDPQKLTLSLTVNGVQRQTGSTEDMVFTVAELIAYLSDGITLLPGDVISTGTPAGTAAFSGAPYLKDGDMVQAAVDGIGSLVNPVNAEP